MVVRELITKVRFALDSAGLGAVESKTNQVKQTMASTGSAGQHAGQRAASGFHQLSGAASRANQSIHSVNGALTNMLGSLGPIGAAISAAFAIKNIQDTADNMMNLDGRLRTVTQTEEERYAVEDKLFSMSQNNRQSLESIGDLYYKVARGAQQFGVTQEDSMRVTDIVSKALTVGGASTSEAKASILQLGQALGSGVLQGDELRSLDENASLLMQHIAENMGVTIGDLKKMGAQGQLTSTAVIDAILASGNAVDGEFDKMPMTIGQSLQMVKNAWDNTTMQIQRRTGIFSTIASGIAGGLTNAQKYVTAFMDLASGPKSGSEQDQSQYSALQNEYPLLSQLLSLWDQIKGTVSTLSGHLSGLFSAIGRLVSVLAPILGPVIAAIGTALMRACDMIVQGLTTVIDLIAFIVPYLAPVIGVLLEIGNAISSFILDKIQMIIDLVNMLIASFEAAWSSFSGAAAGAISAVKGFFSDLYNYAVGIIHAIADAIQSWIGDKVQWATDKLDSLKSLASGISDRISTNVQNAQNTYNQINNVNVDSPGAASSFVSNAYPSFDSNG